MTLFIKLYDKIAPIANDDTKARELADVLVEMIEMPHQDGATKQDIAQLRIELKKEISDFRIELKKEISDLNFGFQNEISRFRLEIQKDISGLDEKISNLKTEIYKQTLITISSVVAIMAFLLKFMH